MIPANLRVGEHIIWNIWLEAGSVPGIGEWFSMLAGPERERVEGRVTDVRWHYGDATKSDVAWRVVLHISGGADGR